MFRVAASSRDMNGDIPGCSVVDGAGLVAEEQLGVFKLDEAAYRPLLVLGDILPFQVL